MRKVVGLLFKSIIAGIISIVLLSLLSLIYCNPPIAIQQPEGITNFKYKENSKWTFMLEGAGYGKTDNLGYNNAYYTDCQNPDIVFVGSSQLEGLQVPQNSNFVYLLNDKFDKDSLPYNDFKCLNIGVSGHFFEVSSSNYQYIAEAFKGAKYIVIETFNVEFTPQMLDDIIECKFHSPEKDKGFIHETVKRIPYIRLIYKKIGEIKASENINTEIASNASLQTENGSDIEIYSQKMNIILGRIKEISNKNDIEPIVLIHERFWEDKNGNFIAENREIYKNAFKKCCDKNGISVIDCTPVMIEEFKENYIYSYGFSNSAPGEGHLNKNGHRIIAEKLYKTINEMEETK